jgi:PAS domain S-box-containing protein
MNRLEEIEKKNQGLKEKIQRLTKAASDLKRENARISKELHEKGLLINGLPAGICLLWRGRIIEVNDTFLDYMGYRADEMINRNFFDFIRHDHLSEARFIHNRWNAGKVSRGHYDTWLVGENGESIFCCIESKRIRYRGKASYLLNITRLEERAENQKKQHNEIRKEAELKMTGLLHKLLRKRADAMLEMLNLIRVSKDTNRTDFKEIAARLRQEQETIHKETWMLDLIAKEKEEVQEKKLIEINRIIKEAITKSEGMLKKGEASIKSYLRQHIRIS